MKNVIIIGANRGLGLGFTRHYLEVGYSVYATARNPAECDALDELRWEHGEQLTILELDVGDEASIAVLAERLNGTVPDLVINNAGACPDEPFGRWTGATFEDALRVNTIGPALVAQALIPSMPEGSRLINISSGLASKGLNINPETGLDAYATSKAALNMVSRRLASKLEPKGIVVVAFDPGWVKTRMGGDEAELTVDESISAMTDAIDRLTIDDSGRFLTRNGEDIPW